MALESMEGGLYALGVVEACVESYEVLGDSSGVG